MDKQTRDQRTSRRWKASLMAPLLILPLFFSYIRPASAAGIPVFDTVSNLWDIREKILKDLGTNVLNSVVRKALNKVAYDTANYIASGGRGQSALFITEDPVKYVSNLADSAAGEFIDSLNEWGNFNLCEPSNPNLKVQIGLGLTQYEKPAAPACTFTKMAANWEKDINAKFKDITSEDYLDKVADIFNPTSNETSIAFSLLTGLQEKKATTTEGLWGTLGIEGLWKNERDIAGNTKGTPGLAENTAKITQEQVAKNVTDTKGDNLLGQAAQVFLNQLALATFQNTMANLGKKISVPSGSTGNSDSLTNAESQIRTGEVAIKEKTATIIAARFDTKADYDILAELASCVDSKNPSPNSCAISERFSQAISDHRLVIDAVKDGYLAKDTVLGDEDNMLSYRNLVILRKFRIIPAGWEIAAQRNLNMDKDKRGTLMDYISCFDPVDQYQEFTPKFDASNCAGLVDPNWVLKAPLNYCAMEGAGGYVMAESITDTVDEDGNPKIQIDITRSEDYCADEQTCIKENSDGTCAAYGYCDQEKNAWDFAGDSCEPINNTCRAFSSPSGASVAYLENTIDYGVCNADNVGCSQYAYNGSYNTAAAKVDWNGSFSMYLGSQAESCDAGNEGCGQYIRLRPGVGSNMVVNADFGYDSVGDESTGDKLNAWPIWSNGDKQAEIVDGGEVSSNLAGIKVLRLSASKAVIDSNLLSVAVYSDQNNSLLPAGFETIPGYSYTLSADVYLAVGDKVKMYVGSDKTAAAETIEKNKWTRLAATRAGANPFADSSFQILGYSGQNDVTIYVKNIKFETNDWDSGYSKYLANPTYEKVIPAYLESACYANPAANDYSPKAGAPSICSSFARRCNASEVGCESFTSVLGNISLTARTGSSDYCNAQCIGYDRYVSKSSYFAFPAADNIIPANANSCSAEAVGCSEFTNLDELSQGGEKKEYYSQLKQCIRPDEGSCADFYLWEGGTQLQVLTLKQDVQGNPVVVADDASECNEQVFNLPPSSPLYNADCREFHSKSGQISYHLLSRTVTCSDDCKRYRLSDHNFDVTVSESQCVGSDRSWDSQNDVCYVCKNGGKWDNTYKACIYQAIPSEGKTCSASQAGCREYNGKDGNSQRLIASYDFEDSSLSGWTAMCGINASGSQESSAKGGQSLLVTEGSNNYCPGDNNDPRIQVDLGGYLSSGKAYVISFLAKAATDVKAKAYIYNDNNEKDVFNTSEVNRNGSFTITGGGAWQLYRFNLEEIVAGVGMEEFLAITADGDFYLDNLTINEMSDRYYLIKGSSQVPDVCSYDNFDQYRGADYNLGCRQYSDRFGVTHNLKSFSKICEAGSVGCEMMVDTGNYTPYEPQVINDANGDGACGSGEADCFQIPADAVKYVIYDTSKRCNAADKGCSRLGQNVLTSGNSVFSDVFRKLDYDKYSSIFCGANAVGCQKYRHKDGLGTSYFKDPGANVCEYRLGKQSDTIKAWYKKQLSKCDLNSDGAINPNVETTVCLKDSDCAGVSCVKDVNDYPCAVSFYKTIGLGGQVPVPATATGLCDAAESTCTEYIDPISRFNDNLLDWNSDSAEIYLDPYRLYSLVATKSGSMDAEVSVAFPHSVSRLHTSNNFEVRLDGQDLPETLYINSSNTSLVFNSLNQKNEPVEITCTGGCNGLKLELKELSVSYQLSSSVDKSSCNGTIDEQRGCILFDERSQNGSKGLSSLYWTTISPSAGQPILCNSGNALNASNCFANSIIKVEPDRICGQWLDCKTYSLDPKTGEKVCYDLVECNRLDDAGNCVSVVEKSANDNSPTAVFRSTGYSYIDHTGSSTRISLSDMKEVGLNTNAHYDFEENLPALSCQRSTSVSGAGSGACTFDKNIVADSVVSDPDDRYATDYPAHGEKYLKVLSYYVISPMGAQEKVDVMGGQDYYINYLLNTKDSGGLDARVTITQYSASGGTISSVSFSASAPTGWERRVHKFETADNASSIRISLTSDATAMSSNYVYYDDINIEPVLDLGDGRYEAKDCRLYPETGSIVCASRNNNVIKDGIEGYCLFRDSKNPDVCLMWYPVDKISSSILGSRQMLGYRGVAPLYYCTQVDANFEFMEKRVGRMVSYAGGRTSADSLLGRLKDNGADGATEVDCGSLGIKVSDIEDECKCVSDSDSIELCGSSDYTAVYEHYWDKEGSNGRRMYVYCVPKQSLISLATNKKSVSFSAWQSPFNCQINFNEGWAKYDGLLNYGSKYTVANNEVGTPDKMESINEASNVDSDPVRILDGNSPAAAENSLKLINGEDRSKVYDLACTQFSKAVDESGNNKAWTGRVSSLSDPYETPSFFGSFSTAMYKYGRNRETIPYGAATLPDDYDLTNGGMMTLKSQYSKEDGDTKFAGRPYGCNSSEQSSCSYVGYCSLDPNVYCLLDPITKSSATNTSASIEKLTCADGKYGTCVSIWDASRIDPDSSGQGENILKNIFLKTYGRFTWNSGNGVYEITSSGTDYSKGASSNYPQVSNVKFNNESGNSFSAKEGINNLTFNTAVNLEQQPLKEIYIDWGDGTIQTIVGQDNRPGSSEPHVFYHYYDSAVSRADIRIEAVDNWGQYGCYNSKCVR